MEIRFQGRLDESLYRQATRINGAKRSATWVTVVGLFAFGALFSRFIPWLGGTLLAVGVLTFIALVIMERQVRRNWKTHKLMHEPFHGALSEGGYELVSEHGSFEAGWDRFHQWQSTPSMLLIYASDASFSILARSYFASDADWQAARELVARKLPSRRRAHRRSNLWSLIVWIVVFIAIILLWNALTGE